MTHSDQPLFGKTCMVTGATSGIGRAAAHALAQQGATVIVVGRNAEKSAATVDEIRGQTGNTAVEFMLADLSSQKAIRRLAGEFRERHPCLHVLVNNAGGFFIRRAESVDGIEMTLAVNHLGYFLLTNLLLETLKAGAPSRVVNVSALLHRFARIQFDDMQNRRWYSGWRVYRESKLANVLFTYELARRLAGTGVTANALHPGVVATNLGANGRITRAARRLFDGLARFALLTPEQGAQTIVHLATSPDVEGITGRYFANRRPVPSSRASYDERAARRLWEASAALTGLPDPN